MTELVRLNIGCGYDILDDYINIDKEKPCDIQLDVEKDKLPFEKLPDALVRHALNAQTHDNVTVLCCRYEPELTVDSPLLGLTITGAYPVALAQALKHIYKERNDG